MARHLGEHPTYIGELDGIAVAAVAIVPLEEMLEMPGCPNLYWALTNLPDPLISVKTGTEGERMSLSWFARELDKAAPMSAHGIKKFIDEAEKFLSDGPNDKRANRVRHYLDARANDDAKLTAARQRLIASGLPEPRLKTFPADQVMLLDEVRELQARFDETAKIMILPAWQFEALAEKQGAAKRAPAIFADALLPAQASVRRAQGRIEQRIALLRHVEALRLYAAEHNGTFPEKLAEVSVPLPVDPFSGKPFTYDVRGKTAHLRGTPPKTLENTAAHRIHYEVNLKK
jgi:hypothetical protein